jgi:hypothetical protein
MKILLALIFSVALITSTISNGSIVAAQQQQQQQQGPFTGTFPRPFPPFQFPPGKFGGPTNSIPRGEQGVYEVSTRGDFDLASGNLKSSPTHYYFGKGNGYLNKYRLSDINSLYANCPREVAIFAHGFQNAEYSALEKIDRVKMSLDADNYKIPLIGFSWESNANKQNDPNANGYEPSSDVWSAMALLLGRPDVAVANAAKGVLDYWYISNKIAEGNGPKLAQFILDFKNKCKNTDVRLLSHSLGARVIRSALVSLDNNLQWKSNGFRIASVHMLGPAINYNEVAINTPLGRAIQNQVLQFYVLYSPEDDVLQGPYTVAQRSQPLGLIGAPRVPVPKNYQGINVKNELKAFCDADGDGSCDFPFNVRPKFGITGTDYSLSQNIPWTTKVSHIVVPEKEEGNFVQVSFWDKCALCKSVKSGAKAVGNAVQNTVQQAKKITNNAIQEAKSEGNTVVNKIKGLPTDITRGLPNELRKVWSGVERLIPRFGVAAIGDNHFGYTGFRLSSTKGFRDDGAMNIVVEKWRSQGITSSPNTTLQSRSPMTSSATITTAASPEKATPGSFINVRVSDPHYTAGTAAKPQFIFGDLKAAYFKSRAPTPVMLLSEIDSK